MKKIIKTSISIFLLLIIAISCNKEEVEEPTMVYELEIIEANLCQTWRRELLIIDGDTSEPGFYRYDIQFNKDKEYIITNNMIDDQGTITDTTNYYSTWNWADNTNAIITQSFFEMEKWYLYNIILLEEDSLILEENSVNGIYRFEYVLK